MNHHGDRPNQFRAVILDYGAVLCHEPLPHEIEFMAGVFRMSPPEFLALWAAHRGPYDRGDLSTPEYWSIVSREAGVGLTPELIDQLSQADKEMWSRVNTEMINWLSTLRPAGYQTALLSNMQFDMIAHMRANFPWLSHFDHQIFSAEVRTIKPDPAIYRHCLQRLGVEPHEAIFVDDREENVVAARSLGIIAFHFRSVPELRRDLESAGFRHLP
ncbi:MAG TPA: HAD family phosphatase [Candidatus Acidoferrales bacterium]|nr:HAD family phosphatase [Candidatus Acidoferrales bacterium]